MPSKEMTIHEAAEEIISRAVDQGQGQPEGTKFTVQAPTDQFRVPLERARYDQLLSGIRRGLKGKGMVLCAHAGPSFTVKVSLELASNVSSPALT